MGFISSFKRALNSDESDSGGDEYVIAGKQVVCSHCGGTQFEESEAQLNTRGLTFLDLDWANQSADVLVCCNCGHLEWFMDLNR